VLRTQYAPGTRPAHDPVNLNTLNGTSMFDKAQSTIANVDPEIWKAIQDEDRRQEEHIELIASENYTSPAVMAAQGSTA
jgi:hypothetical protein